MSFYSQEKDNATLQPECKRESTLLGVHLGACCVWCWIDRFRTRGTINTLLEPAVWWQAAELHARWVNETKSRPKDLMAGKDFIFCEVSGLTSFPPQLVSLYVGFFFPLPGPWCVLHRSQFAQTIKKSVTWLQPWGIQWQAVPWPGDEAKPRSSLLQALLFHVTNTHKSPVPRGLGIADSSGGLCERGEGSETVLSFHSPGSAVPPVPPASTWGAETERWGWGSCSLKNENSWNRKDFVWEWETSRHSPCHKDRDKHKNGDCWTPRWVWHLTASLLWELGTRPRTGLLMKD